jgi:hemoglobin-like flavoprotein
MLIAVGTRRAATMTPRQIQLIQETFAHIEPIAETAAGLFYARLFTLDPGMRRLFKSDMQDQGRKLMQMLAVAVRGLNAPDQLMPAVRALGMRHAGYGVKPGHYGTVASALLWTLDQGLGDAFTPEVQVAWTTVYGILAGAMLDGAAEASSMPIARSA